MEKVEVEKGNKPKMSRELSKDLFKAEVFDCNKLLTDLFMSFKRVHDYRLYK